MRTSRDQAERVTATATPAVAGGRNNTSALRASVLTSMAGKSMELVTLLLLATLLPRMLGPGRYGRFAVPLTLVTLGSLALTLGGPTVMARYVPAAAAGTRVALARALGARLARGRAIQLALIGAGALVAVAVAPVRIDPLDAALVFGALTLNVAATLALRTTLGLGRTTAWSLRYPATQRRRHRRRGGPRAGLG